MWATNSSGWDDKGADLQCLVCRHSQDSSLPQDPNSDPASNIMILLVTPEIVAANPPNAYQVLKHLELPGHSSANGPHVKFTNFYVPSKYLLAEPGKGAPLIVQSFTSSAALVGAMSVGIMAATFESALAFAKTDKRGGSKNLMENQSVSDLLIGIKMRCDASRMLTWKACHDLDNGLGGELAYQAKIFCSDNAVKSVVDAMGAVGMSSYDKDRVFPELLNDAICLPLFDGGNVGVRRRQLEKLFMADDYEPWASTYPS